MTDKNLKMNTKQLLVGPLIDDEQEENQPCFGGFSMNCYCQSKTCLFLHPDNKTALLFY